MSFGGNLIQNSDKLKKDFSQYVMNTEKKKNIRLKNVPRKYYAKPRYSHSLVGTNKT